MRISSSPPPQRERGENARVTGRGTDEVRAAMWQPSTPAPPPRERVMRRKTDAVDASTTTFLRSIPAFQGFGEKQLKRIRGALRRRAYAAHEILIEQGAAIERDAFFVLASGRVRVFVDGRQVAVLSAGD